MTYPYLVIFSDLDNCLLDRDSYDFSEAAAALGEIRRRNIPLVLVSSKTRGEVEAIRTALAINDPFVVESGAALFIPGNFCDWDNSVADDVSSHGKVEWGLPYVKIREAMSEARQVFAIRGFGDMDVGEVAMLTGLPLEQVRLASLREYTEPFLLDHPEHLLRLIAWAAERGLQILAGGRFYHLAATGQDKGRAVRWVIEHYRKHHSWPVITMALGDSPNDLPMLAAVDMPVLLPDHQGGYADLRLPDVVRGTAPSSRGWNHHVLAFLRLFGQTPVREEGGQLLPRHLSHNHKENP